MTGIRTFLLESEEHECPDCNEKDVSPETLIPNRFLRNAVMNFKNETGYAKRQTYRPPAQSAGQTVVPIDQQPKIETPQVASHVASQAKTALSASPDAPSQAESVELQPPTNLETASQHFPTSVSAASSQPQSSTSKCLFVIRTIHVLIELKINK